MDLDYQRNFTFFYGSIADPQILPSQFLKFKNTRTHDFHKIDLPILEKTF